MALLQDTGGGLGVAMLSPILSRLANAQAQVGAFRCSSHVRTRD